MRQERYRSAEFVTENCSTPDLDFDSAGEFFDGAGVLVHVPYDIGIKVCP